MRIDRRLLVATCVAGLIGAWLNYAVGQAPVEQSQLQPRDAPPGCLQVVSQPGDPITVIVYDPQQQVLGVYHVDRLGGEIELKSIRQIEWDLKMLNYNGKGMKPEEIRNGLPQ